MHGSQQLFIRYNMQQLFAGPTIICPELARLKIGCYNTAQKSWTTFWSVFKKEFASKTKNQFIIDSRAHI
jgi:hypothetical protein